MDQWIKSVHELLASITDADVSLLNTIEIDTEAAHFLMRMETFLYKHNNLREKYTVDSICNHIIVNKFFEYMPICDKIRDKLVEEEKMFEPSVVFHKMMMDEMCDLTV